MTKGVLSIGVVAALLVGVWFGWSAWQDRAREAAYRDGLALVEEERFEDALALAKAYAEDSDPDFDHLMAEILLAAPPPLEDEERGLELQRRAAEAGQHRAGVKLARRLLDGEPSREAFDQAFGYLTAAADCGMPDAHFQLGWLYVESDFLERDLEAALKHFEFAAWSGVDPALWNAGTIPFYLYEDGPEMPLDVTVRAIAWRLVSARFGNQEGLAFEDRLSGGTYGENEDDLEVVRAARSEADRVESLISLASQLRCGFISPDPW